MGELIIGMASSHAFAIEEPAGWDTKRQRNREHYAARYGALPPEQAGTAGETDEDVRQRYQRVRDAHAFLRGKLANARPDALVMVADDQDECFTDGNFPQIAVYLGGDFEARDIDRSGPRHHRQAAPAFARALFETLVDAGIDAAAVTKLPDDYLPAHAFGPVLKVVDPDGAIPVVPVFVNCIHVPAPSPARCHYLGQVVRQAAEAFEPGFRVAICGSGGLSHFPSSYPPGFTEVEPFPWGAIDVAFDRWALGRMQEGEGKALAELSNLDLLAAGEAELRSWIAVLGAVGASHPELLVYEPFHRGMMGIGVGCWDLSTPHLDPGGPLP